MCKRQENFHYLMFSVAILSLALPSVQRKIAPSCCECIKYIIIIDPFMCYNK